MTGWPNHFTILGASTISDICAGGSALKSIASTLIHTSPRLTATVRAASPTSRDPIRSRVHSTARRHGHQSELCSGGFATGCVVVDFRLAFLPTGANPVG